MGCVVNSSLAQKKMRVNFILLGPRSRVDVYRTELLRDMGYMINIGVTGVARVRHFFGTRCSTPGV